MLYMIDTFAFILSDLETKIECLFSLKRMLFLCDLFNLPRSELALFDPLEGLPF